MGQRAEDLPFAFLPENRLAQLLNTYPASADWLRQQGIALTDTQRPLDAVLDDQQLFELALAIQHESWLGDAGRECGRMTMDELVDHIESVHHAYTRAELGRLARIADKLNRCTQHDGDEWFVAFDRLRRHLLAHLAEEEELLFPACRALEHVLSGRPVASNAVDNEIRIMEHGHDEVEGELDHVEAALARCSWPQHQVATASALMRGLDALRHDLDIHRFKEDEFLMPAAIHADELYDSRRRSHIRNRSFKPGTEGSP